MSAIKKIQLCVCYPTEKTQQLTLTYNFNFTIKVKPAEIISITIPQTDVQANENIPKLNEIFHYLTTIEENFPDFIMNIDNNTNIINTIYNDSGDIIQIQGLFEGIDNVGSLIEKINTLIQEIKANTSATSAPVTPGIASKSASVISKSDSPSLSSSSNIPNPIDKIPNDIYLLKPNNQVNYFIKNKISRYIIYSVDDKKNIKLERFHKNESDGIPSYITISYDEFIKNITINRKYNKIDDIGINVNKNEIKLLQSYILSKSYDLSNIILFVSKFNEPILVTDYYPYKLTSDKIISISDNEVKSKNLPESIDIDTDYENYFFYIAKINQNNTNISSTANEPIVPNKPIVPNEPIVPIVPIVPNESIVSNEPTTPILSGVSGVSGVSGTPTAPSDITDENLNELIQKLQSSNSNELSKDILKFMGILIKDLQEQITKTKSVYENLIKLGNNNNNEELNNLLEKIDINSLKNIKNNSKTIQNFINTISNKISGDKTEIERKKAEIDKLYNELIDESTKLLNEIEQKKTSTISVQPSQSPVTQSIISTSDDISDIFKDDDEDYNIYISLNFYLGSGYILFNTYLRSGLSIDDFFANQDIMKEILKKRSDNNKKYFNKNVLQKMIEYIDLTFEKYGETSEEEKILYRGIHYDKEPNLSSTEDIQIEGTQKSFISATSDITVAQFKFTNTSNCCVLVLKLSKGIKFLNINEIINKIYNKINNNYSNIHQPAITSGYKMEILLPRNLYFLSKGIIQDKKTIPNIPELLLDETYKMTYYDINVYLNKPENTYLLQQTADGGNKKRIKKTKKRHKNRKFRKTRAIK